MKLCSKLQELPTVTTEWQQSTWCPDCEYYDQGTCSRPAETSCNTPCPLDTQEAHLRMIEVDRLHQDPEKSSVAVGRREQGSQQPPSGLDDAIKQRILQRTGGRLRMLAVEVSDQAVVLRGCASCYYLTQLAIQATLDVIGSNGDRQIELKMQVMGDAGVQAGSDGCKLRSNLHEKTGDEEIHQPRGGFT